MTTSLKRFAAASLAGVGLWAIGSAPAVAQAPKVFFACYVPSSGAVYRIKEPNTPTVCGTTVKKGVTVTHVEFSWTDAVGADHGAMTGLDDDDHPKYLLTNGTRISNAGFALVRSAIGGAIPASGPGTRMMWYPGKGAIRAGQVNNDQWDDFLIGQGSAAFGLNTKASGQGSFAAGVAAVALGDRSVALGEVSTTTGYAAFAAGSTVAATGNNSTALGSYASTNGKSGAFVYGDQMSNGLTVNAQADNQFVVRAQQFWLGTNNSVTATAGRFIETSTGAYLSSGGAWTNSSDSAKKAGFQDVDGDEVLAKVAAIPIRTWNYRSEDSAVRHIGPTAQDFRAAFGLGDGDKAIATVDADGVSLAAIQALVRRVGQLEAQLAQLLMRSPDAGVRP